jgi:hypothetical protein
MHDACGVVDTACIVKLLNNLKQGKLYVKWLCYAKDLKMQCQ